LKDRLRAAGTGVHAIVAETPCQRLNPPVLRPTPHGHLDGHLALTNRRARLAHRQSLRRSSGAASGRCQNGPKINTDSKSDWRVLTVELAPLAAFPRNRQGETINSAAVIHQGYSPSSAFERPVICRAFP